MYDGDLRGEKGQSVAPSRTMTIERGVRMNVGFHACVGIEGVSLCVEVCGVCML